jgi:hypothetical protein
MSHTVTVAIEFRDPEALGRAVVALGGTVLGKGRHRLFAGAAEDGFGFRLSNWNYPLVLTASGHLKYDDYNGTWGNVADLKQLEAEYAIQKTILTCESLLWQYQRENDGTVTVFHPDGGTLKVLATGEVDALGFSGMGCQAAVEAISQALGRETGAYCKRERNDVLQRVVTVEVE